MRMSVVFAVPLILLGCTARQAETLATTSAADAQRIDCIDATRIAGRRAQGNRALVFELSDGTVVRNDLPDACQGLARASSFGTLAIDPIESRMCRGDSVRIYDPADLPVGGIKAVPRCRLGAFTRVAAD
ncbi:hypothetical protein E2493_06830 [Sphingomonas parva]|uniref:Lipoprotein n=1 Tax=Sphingomonas parva TaxID=2555898 RepID=A0A4Y8ZWV3_9SPHN|nr:hypothetical protein [Sphingomonas parva]TFI58966.1 hypothetical protein E2493_06830 [Sphingomonas parva]